MWEIFNIKTCAILRKTRFRLIAFLICRKYSGLDYAREGEGWI